MILLYEKAESYTVEINEKTPAAFRERLNFILKRAGMFNAAETKSFSRNLLVNYILTDPGQHLE